MPRPTTKTAGQSNSMVDTGSKGRRRAAKLSLARLASDGPLDGVSRAKVFVHLSRSRQACACVCLRMPAHAHAGGEGGLANRLTRAAGCKSEGGQLGSWEAGEWSLWGKQPIDKGSSPPRPGGK